jgi:hypothetical protein
MTVDLKHKAGQALLVSASGESMENLTSERMEERMARFKASTAELKTIIGGQSAMFKQYIKKNEGGGATYASTLIDATELDFKQDRDKLAALVNPNTLLSRLNTSPTCKMHALTTLPNRNLHTTPGFPSAIQDANVTCRNSSGRPTL